MPSNENKTPSTKTEKKDNVTQFEPTAKAEKPKKKKFGFGWWLGMIVLIVVAITFVLPSGAIFTGAVDAGITFGKYGKESITYEPGNQNNYFTTQVQNIASNYSGSKTNAFQANYEIWWQAFQNTVLYTALSQMADKAGIIANGEVINRAIIDSGVYNKDGKFDVATYNAASAEYKSQIERQAASTLPFNIVLEDLTTVLSSTAEAEYVSAMASDVRSFDYAVFNAAAYPNELAKEYGLKDPQQFVQLDVALVGISDADTAATVAQQIADGTITFEEAVSLYNEDTALDTDGKLGVELPYYSLATNFSDPEAVNTLFAAKEGSVVGPYASPYGMNYIYRVDSTPVAPDFDNQTTINLVKQYLATNDAETVSAYALEKATAFSEAAKTDFNAALDTFEPGFVSVTATPANFSGSSYMSSFDNTDQYGFLADAATDKAVMKELFTAEVGTVTGPLKSGTNYIVAEVTDAPEATGTSTYITTFYDYFAGSMNQQDEVQAVFNSSEFTNDFLNVFLSKVMGS